MRRLLTLVLIVAACAPPVTLLAPAPPVTMPSAVPTEPPTATAEPPPPAVRPPHIEAPAITLARNTFPIYPPSTARIASPPGQFTEANAKLGVIQYLAGLDRYRDTGVLEHVQIKGPFRDAVLASVEATKRAGVQRKFELTAYRIDRVYAKPWGTQALVDVTATITDAVVSGDAAPEVETGVLRLAGDRNLTVFDGWTGTRWFNGMTPVTREQLFTELQQPFGWYLQGETWIPGLPIQTYHAPGGESPFSKARNALLQGFDRQAVAARTLVDVTATVERFDTLTEIGDGIAAVRLSGTVVRKDSAGVETREQFTRTVRAFRKAFANGHGSFTVVDELGPGGVWLSGGDIALKDLDQSFG